MVAAWVNRFATAGDAAVEAAANTMDKVSAALSGFGVITHVERRQCCVALSRLTNWK